MKYPVAEENVWIVPHMKGYKMACCDCGLVHKLVFRVVEHKGKWKVIFKAYRDNRSTAVMRRHMREEQ